ncbi:MAG: enoyl-CoA hydratase/isomerase family protein [Candidatus Dadabacteria bacterium]|nr:MAG: enoyl-CoA hydratase/isomerase family protein [Candidatus Dadabacteria bacterium]
MKGKNYMAQELVSLEIVRDIGRLCFYNEKGNALSCAMLEDLAVKLNKLSENTKVTAVVIMSQGNSAFCGGALLDELDSPATAKSLFHGFRKVILAIRDSSKFIIARVHGKTVGGGVGIVAACDFAFASSQASIKLSELSLGIAPFVISLPLKRKIGLAALSQLAVEAEWKEPLWALQHGLYTEVLKDAAEVDKRITWLCEKLSSHNDEALMEFRRALWEGSDNWSGRLERLADMSYKFSQSDYVKNRLFSLKKR